MVKADLGTKRVCPSCASRFYDLGKRPIECPKCAFTFEPEALYKQRRPRQPEAVSEDTTGTPAEAGEEEAAEEEEETTKAEEAGGEKIVETVEGEAPLKVGNDDDEEDVDEEEEEDASDLESEGAGMQVVEADEDLEDIETDDVDEDSEDDTLLEEVEEDDDDVSGIIDADIEKDER